MGKWYTIYNMDKDVECTGILWKMKGDVQVRVNELPELRDGGIHQPIEVDREMNSITRDECQIWRSIVIVRLVACCNRNYANATRYL